MTSYSDAISRSVYDQNDVIAEFLAERQSLYHVLRDSWWTEVEFDATKFDSCQYRFTGEHESISCVVTKDNSVIALDLSGAREVNVRVFSKTTEDAESVLTWLKKTYKAMKVKTDKIEVSFWHLSSQGPKETRRFLQAPEWKTIKGNYAARTSEGIEALVKKTFDQETSGKLILWTGQPGTGKTFAIRALAQEWKAFADIHYVIDPEQFFGREAGYLASVLLDDYQREKWRLIVLEDTGELLTKDAKMRTGQGLSRLLNICDGLLGQGLKVLVLITTNEEVQTLHEAVSRSGRCAADIVFHPLSTEETRIWGLHNGVEVMPTNSPLHLSELYALKTGTSTDKREVKRVGFFKN